MTKEGATETRLHETHSTGPIRRRQPRSLGGWLPGASPDTLSPVASSPQGPARWARLRRDTQSVLRRGAWYRVLSVGADEAVVDVDNAAVRVARPDLEVTETRPNRWTIVPRPRLAEKVPASWGEFYAVCPNCAARAPVGRPPGEKRCTRCEQSFEVAWDERYLRES